ncbi:hypothetical protein ABH920_003937 [Catenulispora sp. EB89]|uniref:GAP family protein n=1 Tax=Catenulispora sp. EB89 TaxID=3156257 RepID=UPI003516FC3C
MLWEAVPTALAASFSPATLVVVAGLLARERGRQLSLAFLAAAAAVTLMVGFLVVTVLADTRIDDSRRHPTVPPALDIALGVAAVVFAVVMLRRPPRDKKERRRETRLATAVVLGLAMGSPSPMYLMSLHSVAQAKPAVGVRTAEVILIAAIVLLMAELPILTYLVAPERTSAMLGSANAWFARHGRVITVVVAAGAGCYFVVKGLVRLL